MYTVEPLYSGHVGPCYHTVLTVCLQWNPSIVATLVLAIIQYSMYTVEPLYSGHVGPCYHTVLTVCIQWNPSIVATLVLVIVQYLQYVYNGTPL